MKVKMQAHYKYYIKLPLDYVYKVYTKQMNFMFGLKHYPHEISLYMCKYSIIWKKSKTLVPAFREKLLNFIPTLKSYEAKLG